MKKESCISKQKVFFAIPCGGFYRNQAKIIEKLCKDYEIHCDIDEEDHTTRGLWENITRKINESDFFVADVSNKSPNILLELGFAISQKGLSKCGIFKSKSSDEMSDITSIVHRKFGDFQEFEAELSAWLSAALEKPRIAPQVDVDEKKHVFLEEFFSKQQFEKYWHIPQGSQHIFKDGIRFSSIGGMPFMTNNLGLLGKNHDVHFELRILSNRIGLIVLGQTLTSDAIFPTFFCMVQLHFNGLVVPHVFFKGSWSKSRKIQSEIMPSNKWTSIVLKVRGFNVTMFDLNQPDIEENINFEVEFPRIIEEASNVGQVGFRCAFYPDEDHSNFEEANIKSIKVYAVS